MNLNIRRILRQVGDTRKGLLSSPLFCSFPFSLATRIYYGTSIEFNNILFINRERERECYYFGASILNPNCVHHRAKLPGINL